MAGGKIRWRKLFRTLHRDIGYAVAALTLAYCISGIAVNHIDDWNPNYTFVNTRIDVGGLPVGDYQAMQDHVVTVLELNPKSVKGHFMETETLFRVFLTNTEEVSVNVETGRGLFKQVKTRAVLYELNALHLNSIKGIWTWVADIFALMLIILVLTGLFMMKGKRGIAGRGKWFVGAGLAIPVVFIWYTVTGA
ncbi:MAG: hypothetical protein GY811_17105 [Myxococcales bacterium]|nr:hypothetical protein [Myxococcales bacterium]